MPSPFPGTNPYLEQADCWEDFHRDFCAHLRRALESVVGPNYIVKLEARLVVRERSAKERGFIGKADIGVLAERPRSDSASAALANPAPVQLTLPATETEEQLYLEVRERRNRRVVTVIEVLSPSNKEPGSDRDDYLAKRRQVLAARTHFIEIDLLRGGEASGLSTDPSVRLLRAR